MRGWLDHTRDRLARLRRLADDQSGATTLEWTLLLAAIAIPSYWLVKICLAYMVDYYRLMTTLNSLPFP
jgi:hypothetical protein